jgi:hypothetical protein
MTSFKYVQLTCRETGLDCDFVIKGETMEEFLKSGANQFSPSLFCFSSASSSVNICICVAKWSEQIWLLHVSHRFAGLFVQPTTLQTSPL